MSSMVPEQVQNLAELRNRQAVWENEHRLISDVPAVIGRILSPNNLLMPSSDDSSYRTIEAGKATVEPNGTVTLDALTLSSYRKAVTRDFEGILSHVILMACVDAAQFLEIPADRNVESDYMFYRGVYVASSGAAAPHVDEVASGLSYLCAVGAPTEFIPGMYTEDQVYAEDIKDVDITTFESGDVLRVNSLQLHKAPELAAAAPRAFIAIDIEDSLATL